MEKKHKLNLPPLLGRIILFCVYFLLVNCEQDKTFERNVDFSSGWEQNISGVKENKTLFEKEFNLKVQPEKIYLVQLFSPTNITEFKVNNKIVPGTRNAENMEFNITSFLNSKNKISFLEAGKPTANKTVKAKLNCVNKLYISTVTKSNKNKQVFVEIKIKNVSPSEKQGILKYRLFGKSKKPLAVNEKPVFIQGNAEYLFKQDFGNLNDQSESRIRIECELINNKKIIDKRTINL